MDTFINKLVIGIVALTLKWIVCKHAQLSQDHNFISELLLAPVIMNFQHLEDKISFNN